MTPPRAAAVLVLVLAGSAAAEPAWVGDSLELGLHEDPARSSTIVELVPSGTALEVLERKDGMARVRTGDGKTGWVDAGFLSDTQPGRARIEALEQELAGAQAALADAQAALVAAQASANAERPAAADEDQAIPSEALREMQSLAEENQRLKQQLAELEAVQRMAVEQSTRAAQATAPAPARPPRDGVLQAAGLGMLADGGWKTWHLLLVASVLLLAFSAGGWLVDWGVRRRHGGFRV